MKFWFLDETYRPIEVEAEERNYGLWVIKHADINVETVVNRELLFPDPVSCINAGLSKLRKQLIENDLKYTALTGRPPPSESLHSKFKRTKIPYLWIVK